MKSKQYKGIQQFNIIFNLFIILNIFQCSGIALKIKYPIIFLIVGISSITAIFSYMKNEKTYTLKESVKFILKTYGGFDLIVLLFMMIYVLDLFILPSIHGIPISNAIGDAGMLLMFFLFFPISFLYKMKAIDFKRSVKIFEITVFILAIWYCTMWVIETLYPNSYAKFIIILWESKLFTTQKILEGWGMVRIIQSNLVLLGCGFIINIFTSKNKQIIKYLINFVYFFALCTTYLKTLWIAVSASAIISVYIYIILAKKHKKIVSYNRVGKLVLSSIISILIINIIFDGGIINRFTNFFTTIDSDISEIVVETPKVNNSSKPSPTPAPNPEIQSNTPTTEKKFDNSKDKDASIVSTNSRKVQIELLLKTWKEKPILGQGYGGYIDGYTRTTIVNDYHFEMTFFALLMKTGVLGISSWILLFISAIFYIFKNYNKDIKKVCIVTGTLVSIIITVQTNPYLFSMNTISFLLYIIIIVSGMGKGVHYD